MSVERKRPRGQSIIETVVGIIFLIPIVLFLFDVAVLVLCSSANDNLAKSAARAAASATDAVTNNGTNAAARVAAIQICNNFQTSTLIQPASAGILGGKFMTGYFWNGPGGGVEGTNANCAAGQVCVVTTMRVNVPVPFGPFTGSDFRARAVEPIVSISP